MLSLIRSDDSAATSEGRASVFTIIRVIARASMFILPKPGMRVSRSQVNENGGRVASFSTLLNYTPPVSKDREISRASANARHLANR